MQINRRASKPIVILGVFVADTAYRALRQPRLGEPLLGRQFVLGPGGKGSNQAVAAGRLGAEVSFIPRLGRDAFAEIRSEEHTSALQSLMRSSSAVFCLKHNTQHQTLIRLSYTPQC